MYVNFIFYVIDVLQFVSYMNIAGWSAGNFCSFIVVLNKVINYKIFLSSFYLFHPFK